jgi:L-threonylcarbamoyladenylate synthase
MKKPRPSTARIVRGTAKNLAALAAALRRGEIVGVPTETVYGLAANALDAAACRKIFRAKGRPATDPLIVHLASAADLAGVAVPNSAAYRLAAAFWPGPLTLVLPKRDVIPAAVSAGLPSVAVRVPDHPLFRRLLRLADVPLAAPSANPFGYVSPTTAEHVRAGLGKKIRRILDGGPCRIGLESTIVDLRDPAKPRLLRPGAITQVQLEKVLGCKVATAPARPAAKTKAQLAPGMLTRHYSPRTPVVLHDQLTPAMVRTGSPDEAWLFLMKPRGPRAKNVHWLDPRGDLRGAARKLFGALRALDAAGYRRLHAELAPGPGLAEAINDRLRRAAAK